MTEFRKPLSPTEMLAQTADNESVAFKFFDEKVSKFGEDAVYCFVEGYDAPYYYPRIKNIDMQPREVEFINCGGKKGVIFSYDFISSKHAYSKYVKLYFVDKDYDDNSSLSPDIFVTDGYAVENYYADDACIRNALKGLAAIPMEREKELDAVMEWYEEWKSDFMDATSLFCAWYANTKNNPARKLNNANYKRSFPSSYASFSSEGIHIHPYSISQLNVDYGLEDPVTQQEVDISSHLISSLYDIRGKYVFQLIEEFLEAVKLDSGRKKKYLTKPFEFSRNRNTLLATLSGYAAVSLRLKGYLRSRL